MGERSPLREVSPAGEGSPDRPYRFTALADLIEFQSAAPASHFTRFKEDSVGPVSIPVTGDYSLISMFVERECRGLELVRRRALRNDFGFTRSWRSVTKMPISGRLSKPWAT